jgi:hypothetical protein
MKTNKLLFFIFLTALLCVAGPALAGLGISPSDWIEPNGMMGQKIEKVFTLSRSDASEDLNFTSQITGDLASWIKIENGNSFFIPKGQQQYPVNVTLNIPQNAAKKEYKGEIRLNSSSKADETQVGSIGVLLSALIRIDLTVTDKPYLSYQILQVTIPEQEAGNYVNVVLKVLNEGNVSAKPTKVTADIFDKYNTTKIGSQVITDFSNVAGVAPFSKGDVKFQIPIQLTPEQYWANISIYQDEKVLKTEDLTFSIAKAGSLKPAATNAGNMGLLAIIGAILAVVAAVCIIIGVVMLIKKGKKNNLNIQQK